jgi:hypothetical protein
MGASLCPATQSDIALLQNNGKLVFYRLKAGREQICPYRMRNVANTLGLDENLEAKCEDIRFVDKKNNLAWNLSSICNGFIP